MCMHVCAYFRGGNLNQGVALVVLYRNIDLATQWKIAFAGALLCTLRLHKTAKLTLEIASGALFI